MKIQKNKTIKELRKELFNKGYFLRGYYDSGIKLYKIWDLNTHLLIEEDITTRKLRQKIKEVLK